MMAEGMYKCEKALKTYAECEKSGEWPNREPRILTLDYPGWPTVLVWKSPPNPRRILMTSFKLPREVQRQLVSITPMPRADRLHGSREQPLESANMETARSST